MSRNKKSDAEPAEKSSSVPVAETDPSPSLAMRTSRHFPGWLKEMNISLALSTYQAGMLLFLSPDEQGRISVFNRHLERAMGMAVKGQDLFLASAYQVHAFRNALPPGEKTADGYDRVLVPQVSWTTGDVDAHDLALDDAGRPIFVSSLFCCLATVSESHSLRPVWTPPWISRLAAEDRCHLNGLAMRDGRPAYVTSVSTTDLADSWRDHRHDGGVVVSVSDGEIVAGGLSMPHSPRLYRGRLWLHQSGSGAFGFVDEKDGSFTEVAFCPGYLRGLDFINKYAVMTLSLPRPGESSSGLALEERLVEAKAQPRCAIFVVDLDTGDVVHWCRIEGVINELYDVVVLRETAKPMAIGFKNDEIRRVISLEDASEGQSVH